MTLHHQLFTVVAACFVAGVLSARPAGADEGFDRYAIILSKKPFGIPPEPPPEPAPPPPASSPSLLQELRVCALTDVEGRGVRASLVENKTNRSYTLRIGETIEDLTLISADLENEEVLIQRGSETAVMKLASGAAQKAAPAAKPGTPKNARSVVSSKKYEDRRRALADRKKAAARPPPKPKYTGEALRQHLREYNMEAIRQGLPALPIELSPEQDDQLVMEGFLPPGDDSFTSANDPLLIQAVEEELRQEMGR